MEKQKFYDEVIAEIKDQIPEPFKEHVLIDVREINKTNDEKKMAVSIRLSPTGVAPMLYLDEFYEEYQDGETVEDIASHILCMAAEAGVNAPDFETISMDYDDIADKLTMQMVEGERNKERLQHLVYRPIEQGMVLIPYIELGRDDGGAYRAPVTKEMAHDLGYDVDKLLDKAFDNLVENNVPAFFEMGLGPLGLAGGIEDANLMREGFEIEGNSHMYILTNHRRDDGSSVLFYPGVQERIGELLGQNYYVLPSSVHEMIIVPEHTGVPLEHLQQCVKDANRTIIQPQEILSDRVFFFDREKHKLYEPKGRERDGDERGDR